MRKSIESILTRGIAILSKFFIVTFLAQKLSVNDYGNFQFILYFIMLSVYINGLEFYMYSNREVLKKLNNTSIVNEHINFFITLFPLTFLTQITIFYLLASEDIFNIKLLLFILVVIFIDYLNQEIYRYLIVLEKVRKANILLIVKSSTFLIFIIIYSYLYEILNFKIVIELMFLSYLLSLVITLIYFFKYIIKKDNLSIKIFKRIEIKELLKVLKPFIYLMIFTKGLEFFDKFAIKYFLGAESLGVYSLFFSITSLIYIFIVSGFYIIYLPKIGYFFQRNNKLFVKEFYYYSILTITFTFVISFLVVIFIDPLLKFIAKNEFINYLDLFYLLIVAFILLTLSLIPSLLLYIADKEKKLMQIEGIIFLINILINIFLIKNIGLEGSAYALIISYFISLLMKSYEGIKIWKEKMKQLL